MTCCWSPVGILLVVRLIPADLMREFRQEALQLEGKPKSRVGVAIVVGMWLLGGGLSLGSFGRTRSRPVRKAKRPCRPAKRRSRVASGHPA